MAASKPSATSLEGILHPLPLRDFLGQSWNKALLHLPGERERFSSLFSWGALNQLLERNSIQEAGMQVVRNGTTVPSDKYLRLRGGLSRIDAGALSSLLSRGASLIVNYIDDLEPAIGHLADQIGNALPAKVGVNLYASWPGASGFALHWDRHDVLVLQIAGAEDWTVYDPTRVDPIESDEFPGPAADAVPAWQCRLEDGDVLYIPRGWWHAAKAGDEGPSLHLTIALTQPTGAGYLQWFVDQLAEHAEVRASIPIAHGADAVAEWFTALRDVALTSMNSHSLASYIEMRSAVQLARTKLSLPDVEARPPGKWDERTRVRVASTKRLIWRSQSTGRCRSRGWRCRWMSGSRRRCRSFPARNRSAWRISNPSLLPKSEIFFGAAYTS